MRSALTAMLISAALAAAGCTGNPYRLPQVPYDTSNYQNLGESEVRTTGIMLFSFIPINLTNKIERATRAAIERKGGDAMVDIEVQESWFWAYVLNGYRVRVKGTVLKKK